MYKNLEVEIEKLGLTRNQFAEKVGMKPDTFYRKISGQRDFKFNDIQRIVNAINPSYTIEHLFAKGSELTPKQSTKTIDLKSLNTTINQIDTLKYELQSKVNQISIIAKSSRLACNYTCHNDEFSLNECQFIFENIEDQLAEIYDIGYSIECEIENLRSSESKIIKLDLNQKQSS